MRNKFLFILFSFLQFGGCQSSRNINSIASEDEPLYRQSITNAMSPNSSKINYDLISISKQNTDLIWKNFNGEDYLLVVAWKSKDSIYKPYLDSNFYNTGNYPIWVTTSPELRQRMKHETEKDTTLRIKQLLGLPPNNSYDYFIEFWVKPEDLFRPCPDNEITDKQCELCFPDSTDPTYIYWVNENRISRYYNCKDDDYPWTQLGYTYDWNPKNKSHIGLSEFVIREHKDVIVRAVYTTNGYLVDDRNQK